MSVAAAPTAEPPADTDAVPAADQATTFLNLYLREREKRVRLERELREMDEAVAALSARLTSPMEAARPSDLMAAVDACGIGDDPGLLAAHDKAVRLRLAEKERERDALAEKYGD